MRAFFDIVLPLCKSQCHLFIYLDVSGNFIQIFEAPMFITCYVMVCSVPRNGKVPGSIIHFKFLLF